MYTRTERMRIYVGRDTRGGGREIQSQTTTYVCIYVYVYTYVYIRIGVHTCVYVYMYICVCVYTYMCIKLFEVDKRYGRTIRNDTNYNHDTIKAIVCI